MLRYGEEQVGTIIEAVYGDRTSFLDVTSRIAALVDAQSLALEQLTVNNSSMGIIDRHEADPEKRWRENVEQWATNAGDQDPFPGASKQLILKYIGGPPGNSLAYICPLPQVATASVC